MELISLVCICQANSPDLSVFNTERIRIRKEFPYKEIVKDLYIDLVHIAFCQQSLESILTVTETNIYNIALTH